MALPEISLNPISKAQAPSAALLAFFQAEPKEKVKEQKEATTYETPIYAGKKIKELIELENYLRDARCFWGKKNEAILIRAYRFGAASNLGLVGLGKKTALDTDSLRQVGAAIYHFQKKEHLKDVSLDIQSILNAVRESKRAYSLQAFCEGYQLASYEYREFKKEDKTLFYPQGIELVGVKGKDYEKAKDRARALVESIFFTRLLGDKPGNALTPKELARLCQEMSRSNGLTCQILGSKEMEKEGMGLLLGVAKGSAQEPQLILMEHKGGRKTDRPFVIIGKGVTFDSGGISLKPSDRMEEMKYDMMGAATVAGIMHACAKLKLPVNVTGYIGAVENMPGGKAQKPGDIQRSLSGKTVEITNTDAEGRLVLADVIEYAQKQNPQAILDFATLTGAVVVALGTVTTGLMGNHKGLIGLIKAASEATDERVWELPLYEEYEEDLRSHYADIRNSGGREAGSQKGGTFLKFFVDKNIPWVHFDIAGSAYHRKDKNYFSPKHGAGVMVRLMAHLLQNWKTLK
ncbi:MAG: leucyl aminopeptidase [Pseudomonadota bacterium]